MRSIVVQKPGKPHVLKLNEIPQPEPSEGQFLIEVKAIGINFADILARKGLYPDAPKPPLVPGYEVSGFVRSVGEKVDKQLVGRKVMAFTCFGGYSEFVAVPSYQVFEVPSDISFEEAAAVPVAFCTAYLLLIVMGSLRRRETILIHNAGGGVGLAAMQIAKHYDAFIIGTASKQKHQSLGELGFDLLIDYRKKNWDKVLSRLNVRKSIDLIIDPLGGKNWRKSFRLLGPTGRLGIYGISAVCGKKTGSFINLLRSVLEMPIYHPLSFLNQNKGVFGVNMAHLWDQPAMIGNWMKEILCGLQQGWLKPRIDRQFHLFEAAEAHTYIESRKNIGKVILTVDESV
jgi:NADPH:quinone reductase-like Zn-dependent oxidoreductase